MVGDVDPKMVEEGWAWHFRKYKDDSRLDKLVPIPKTT